MRRVIVGLVLCVSLLGICSFVKAEDISLTFTGAMNQINGLFLADGNNNSVKTVRWLIETYCTVVFDSSWFTDNGFTYSANQSAFVDLLCSRVGKSAKKPALQAPKTFTPKEIQSLLDARLQDIHYMTDGGNTKTDFCSSKTNLAQCNISKQVPKLFNMIINDYINLKQPSLYGFIPGVTEEVAANTFSAAYFNGLKICDKDGERLYPDTCKVLKKYMQDAQKTFADVQIFDIEKVTKKSFSADTCDLSSTSYSLLLCWLYGDTQNSLQQFLNLTYNELFYYRLFAQYYSWMLTTNAKVLLDLQAKEVNSEVFTRTRNMSNELTWSEWALSLSMRMLRDFYTSFPLHIWFLMYQEDIRTLAKPLGKLYTPLSQFYSLFQHVQEDKK